MNDSGILVSAYIVDLIIGDPRRLPHPVQGIGWCIEKAEYILRKKMVYSEHGMKQSRERLAGFILAFCVSGVTFVFFSLVSMLLLHSPLPGLFPYVSMVIFIYFVSTAIATRGLVRAGLEVIHEVKTGQNEKARERLGMIVGRDTRHLDNRSIFRATVETLSENSSDGIIAPLFYFAIGGLPLAMTYKAINTLDSMVGYRNKRYLNFGWASARLDDIANFLPARITGSIIVIASFLISTFQSLIHQVRSNPDHADHLQQGKEYTRECSRISGRDALRIMVRDGCRHVSPNSGIPEAAMAGALGVKLGGPSSYGGVVSEKPFIGDEKDSSEAAYLSASEMALTITKVTSILGLVAALLLLYVRKSLWN